MKRKPKFSKESEDTWDMPDDSQWDWEDEPTSPPQSSTTGNQKDGPRFSLKLGKKESSSGSAQSSKEPYARKGKLGQKITQGGTKSGTRMLQVTLEYDVHGHKVCNDGLTQGVMLQEIVTMRNIIPDWDGPRWSTFLHNVGNLPVWTVYKSVDIWHILLYACEFIRQHPEYEEAGRGMLQARFHEMHPDFDIMKWQDKIDGKIWGGIPMEDPQYLSFKQAETAPVREQMEAKEKAHVEKNMETAEALPMQHLETAYGQHAGWEAKWTQAEAMARQPVETWSGQVDPEFEAMIRRCVSWLGSVGRVSLDDRIDLFWPPDEENMETQTVKRRHYITGRVMRFWKKMVLKHEGELHLSNPLSYRVVLAAQKLKDAIEMFAVNWQTDPEGDKDDIIAKRVKKYALQYVEAHLPIAKVGGSPGPLATQDPDYIEYLRLCAQYKIKEGTLLHDLEL